MTATASERFRSAAAMPLELTDTEALDLCQAALDLQAAALRLFDAVEARRITVAAALDLDTADKALRSLAQGLTLGAARRRSRLARRRAQDERADLERRGGR